MLNTAYLSLGSNIGNRLNYLQQALDLLQSEEMKIEKISSIYETSAWGYENQHDFLNMAAEVKTNISAHDLLQVILNTELEMGRVREKKWAERIIDIDIVFFNDHIIQTENLIVPHPEMQNRNFVLFPMAEIAPHVVHPALGKSVLELKDECLDKGKIILINTPFF